MQTRAPCHGRQADAVVEVIAAAAAEDDVHVVGGPDKGGEEPEGRGPRVPRFAALRVLKGLSKADLSRIVLRSRKGWLFW